MFDIEVVDFVEKLNRKFVNTFVHIHLEKFAEGVSRHFLHRSSPAVF